MNLLAQPTPPPSGRGLVDHPASIELAGAQQLSFRNDARLYGGPTPNPLTTIAGGDAAINGRQHGTVINGMTSDSEKLKTETWVSVTSHFRAIPSYLGFSPHENKTPNSRIRP